jgi:four helix bundle protein
MGAVKNHGDRVVWQRSVTLASKIYLATSRFPEAERQGLSLQMRQSALAAAASIADGAGRAIRAEYIRFLDQARGSLAELEIQVHIAGNLKLIEETLRLHEEVAELRRSLAALIRKLREERVPGIGIKS